MACMRRKQKHARLATTTKDPVCAADSPHQRRPIRVSKRVDPAILDALYQLAEAAKENGPINVSALVRQLAARGLRISIATAWTKLQIRGFPTGTGKPKGARDLTPRKRASPYRDRVLKLWAQSDKGRGEQTRIAKKLGIARSTVSAIVLAAATAERPW